MDLRIEDIQYLLNSKIKFLEGKTSLIGTPEDSGETFEDLQAQIKALTNLLEMI
jgi:hypothetical protein